MLQHWREVPWIQAVTIVLGSVIVAVLVEQIFARLVPVLTRRTRTDIDDKIVESLRRPVFFSVILFSLGWAVRVGQVPKSWHFYLDGLLETCGVLVWSFTLARIASLIFQGLASRETKNSIIQTRTQPLFDIFSKLAVIAFATYAVMLAWDINVGAWLASAGIAGIALGFAAKDSLSNLFAGIFIVADSPYAVGDFIVLDGELRGAVTSIGFRSTRLLTLDDIEIIVPNSLIGNAQIVNESGGPYHRARVSVTVECAYGSDVDQVRDVLLRCVDGAPRVTADPKPMVRFSSFGASGLVHEVLVWIERPQYRETVVDELNRRIYKAFAQAGIEIPYSKHDVFIKQLPPELSGAPLPRKSQVA